MLKGSLFASRYILPNQACTDTLLICLLLQIADETSLLTLPLGVNRST